MHFSSHELLRGLVIAVPLLIISTLALFHRWLDKRNAEISKLLRRREE